MNGFIAEFKHTLVRLRGQIIGWGVGLALYGLAMGFLYDTINQMEGIEEMLASYPKELMAFLGDIGAINTPAGYFGTYYTLYITLIVGFFAVTAAAALLAGDEEKGLLDLVLSYPVSRTALFWGRWLGYMAALALTLFIGYLGWAVTLPYSSFGASALDLLLAFIPLWALLLVFGALALLLSLLLPSARLGAMVAGALLVGNFLLIGLSQLNTDLQPVMDLTPYRFYQGGDALVDLNWSWVLALLAAALVLAVLAWPLFSRRDIRVGGERSLTLWRPRRAAKA